MGASSARQSQRVLIDAPVRLTLREAARTLPARALDLSEGGIRLAADAALNVGDEVTCNLELDNERATLNGRVRWAKPPVVPAGAMGFGVQFGPLDEEQLGQLRRWLAHNSDHAEVVLLHVPSLREPLRARGCVTADGLQLVASLPQLTPGAELEFQLGDTGSRRLGRIERIDVKPRTEHGALELAVRLQPSAAMAATRSRRNLVYGMGDFESVEIAPGAIGAPPPSAATGTALATIEATGKPSSAITITQKTPRFRGRTQTLQIPKSDLLRFLRWGLGIGAALGIGLLAWHIATPSESRESELEESELAESSTSVSAATTARTAPRSSMALPTLPEVAAPPAARIPEPAVAKPTPTPPPASISPTPSVDTTKVATVVNEEPRLPALNAEGAKSEIFVPMQGSLEGLRTTQWTDPIALILEIPGAHFAAPELLQGLRGGGVKRVRLDETHEAPRLQIYLNTVAARFATKAVPHGLLVVLEHDLRPLPH